MKTHRLAQAVALSGLLASMFVPAPSLAEAPKNEAPPAITIPLEGFVRFEVYAKGEHRVVVDPFDMCLPCTAELIVSDGQNIVLHTQEFIDFGDGPFLFREITFEGKMTPSGVLKFSWPKTWLEMNWETGNVEPTLYPDVITQIEDHTGYELCGRGVNKDTVELAGSFDGDALLAAFHIQGFQVKPGSMGPPYDVVVDGPIEFSIWLDLAVAE